MENEKYLFVVSGAAGTGKDSVVSALRKAHPEIEKTVSATTRSPRPGEQEGVDYYYRTKEQFQQLINQDVHIAGEFFLCKRSSGDGILAGGINHKTDACHFFKQSVRIMLHLILHLIPIERNDLIEVDLLAARQSADFTSVPDNILRTYQKCGAEFRILCKRRLLIHCVASLTPHSKTPE